MNAGRPSEEESGLSLGSVDYPSGFYHEQGPVHLNYVCALNDIAAPDLTAGFRYCELGCGAGETTCILAAANPSAEFVGIDLSPTHIEGARELARLGGLDNVRFIAADLLDFDARELPAFEFVTMHGLYSWVPREVRAAIRHFLADKLRPGGVVYISYNAMPGWGAAGPLRRFFVDTAGRMEGDVIERTKQVIQTLEDLREKGAPFFAETPTAAQVLLRLPKSDIRYVAHEFLGSSWEPLYFADLNREMESVGLRFAAHAEIVENFLERAVVPDLLDIVRNCTDEVVRESIRDFIQNRFFRRDVFVRPADGSHPVARDVLLADTLFGLLASPVQIPGKIKWVGGELEFSGEWFNRVKQILAYRVLTLSEITDDPVLKGCPREDLIEGVMQLSIGGFLAPFARRETEPPAGPAERIRLVPRINEILLERYDWAAPSLVLASPVTGSGVSLNSLEAALVAGLKTDEPVTYVFSELHRRDIGIKTVDGETPIDDEEASRAAIAESLELFQTHKLPKLAYLGIVEPD